ncbi:MAG: hypothetical protein E6J13_15575 [Chloroflexi bacterium]|nr:MAG: hypothetical protein E6J13_15575 [Chloroflexota bacterium]
MTKRTTEDTNDVGERLADAQARIEALEAAAADAEARAATALEELTDAREARSEGEETRTRLAEAAVKYREARLASALEIPQELVPAAESLAEIDEAFEAARRVAAQLRERIEDERQSARVPVGSRSRRPAGLSTLSASEKIRLGLQQLSER